MYKWKKLLKNVCYPPIIVAVLFTAISISGLIYTFATKNPIALLRYLTYAISAYTFIVICFRIPNVIKKISKISNNSKLIVKYRENINFRTKIILFFNVTINLSFAIFNLIMGILDYSLWFFALAVYYILLTVIRLFLLRYTYKQSKLTEINQWSRYRFCGIILSTINVALGIIIFFVIYFDRGNSYNFIHTIAIALFTFIITTVAIVNSIKYRKYHQPIITAVKYTTLASALVSMLSLEIAMLNRFSTTDKILFKKTTIAITGFVVCTTVLIIGISMIVKGTKEIKKSKSLTIS